ncbi:MAG: hypothetical protein R3C01_05550 [Planctomycetaceae bacterium]
MIKENQPVELDPIAERIRDLEGIDRAIRKAQQRALRRHAAEGRQIPVWRDGRVEWMNPVIDDET